MKELLRKYKLYQTIRNFYYHLIDCRDQFQAASLYRKDIAIPSIETTSRRVLHYLELSKVDKYRYKYSLDLERTAFFTSVYAILILGLLVPDEVDKEGWRNYLDSFQESDGLWRDHEMPFRLWKDRSDEWNDIHVIPHIIYAYDSIEAIPKFRFAFLDKFKDMYYTQKYIDRLDFQNIWGESNGLMNYIISMQYARDIMGDDGFAEPIDFMLNKLIDSENYVDGLWKNNFDGFKSDLQAIRGAYHIWPMLEYDGFDLQDGRKVIDLILKTQNKYGGFNDAPIASTCMNIDEIDPLVRFSLKNPGYRTKEIEDSLTNAYKYLLHNQNPDGGFCFERYKSQWYGNEASVARKNESNLFATWFTMVAILIIESYLNDKVFLKSDLPGMERRIEGIK